MGVEVKGAGDGVVIADRGCNDDCCCCDLKKGQQEIKCLIENTAKDTEIARLNQVVAALKTGTTTPA